MTDLQKQFQKETNLSFDEIPINGVHLAYIDWLESMQKHTQQQIQNYSVLTENQIAELASIGSQNLYLDEMDKGRLSYGGVLEIIKRYEELRKTEHMADVVGRSEQSVCESCGTPDNTVEQGRCSRCWSGDII